MAQDCHTQQLRGFKQLQYKKMAELKRHHTPVIIALPAIGISFLRRTK